MIIQSFRMFAFIIGMLVISGCTTPTVDAGSDETVQVNQSVQLTGTVSSTNGANVTYVWKEGSTVLANTASFSYTPTAVGKHTLTFYVSDDEGNKDDDSLVVTATAVPNELPTANAGEDASLEVNQVLTLTGSGTDTDGSIVAYEWKEGATVLADTASFDYTAVNEGTHTLTLTVTDNDGATANDTMNITVTAIPNIAPTANAGLDKSTQVNTAVSITGNGSDSDGTIAAYQWKEGATVLANTASFSYTPSTVGTHTLTLTVTDNNGATANDTMIVTATEALNQAPTANAGADKTVEVTKAVSIVGNGTDSDGTISTYQWKEGATVLANVASFSYTPSTIGTHTLTLTVTDNDGATASDSMNVTVTEVANHAPAANAGPDMSTTVDQTITLSGTGTDTDGTIDTYSWTEAGIAGVIANTASFSYTPTVAGVHTLTLTVTDNDGATASDSMKVTAEETPSEVKEQALIIIRVEFNDYQFQSSPLTWSSKIFGNNESQLNHYMNEISYGSFKFTEATETDGVADGMITVRLNENHPGDLEEKIDRLVTAVELADTYIDYAQYDTDNNGAINKDELQIMFLVAGGEKATGANPGIWAHKWCMYGSNATAPVLDGVAPMSCNYNGVYSAFGEKQFDANTGKDATIGVIAHELGHAVFDLPDLYDTNKGSEGIGNFGLMGAGSWASKEGDTQAGQTPVHMTGWSKIQSGFVTPVEITATEFNVQVHSTTSSDYTLYKVPTGKAKEYFLFEN